MIGWWFGPSYLLGQVNFGIDAAAILGILLAAGGGGFFALRSLRPELSREQDIVIAAISLLCGLILIFKGWELNQIHEFNQFLLTGIAVFLAYDNIRMRSATVEQAKRRTPTVDRKRRTSRVYRAELDEIEPYKDYKDYYDDEEPRPERRRLKGTAVARPNRDGEYDRDYYDDYGERDTERRSRSSDRRRDDRDDRDDDYGESRPPRGYDRRRDVWDDIDYDDDKRGYDRYDREAREYDRDEDRDRDRGRDEDYQERRPRRSRPEGRREEDWPDSRRGWRDEPEVGPERGAGNWQDGDRPAEEIRVSRREDSREEDRREEVGNEDWDNAEERPASKVGDWRGENPGREERPPIPRMSRRRRPSEDDEREPRRRATTTASASSSTTADYTTYEPLDDDYELGESEY